MHATRFPTLRPIGVPRLGLGASGVVCALIQVGVCFCWLLTIGFWTPAQAAASEQGKPPEMVDYIVESAYWEDPSEKASLDTARIQTYTPFKGAFSRGYTDSAHWIKLTLAPSSQPLLLRILPIWLDEITLYDPASAQAPQTQGDRYPLRKHAIQGVGHSFELPASAVQRDIWLRMKTTSASLFFAEAFLLEDASSVATSQIMGTVLYVSILLLFLIVLLPVYWVQRDEVTGLFLLKHTVYVFYGAAYLGLPALLLSRWLPPAFFDRSLSFLIVLLVPMTMQFDSSLLTRYRPDKRLNKIMRLTSWLSVPLMATLLMGHERLALQLNMYLIISCVLLFAVAAMVGKPDATIEDVMPKKVVIVYYLFGLGTIFIGVVGVIGWTPTQEWTLYAMIVHGLISGMMMTTMLFIRAQRQSHQNQKMAWELRKAHQDTELEQRRRQEKSQFLHMLMHELKTPLSVVSIALGTHKNREANLDSAGRAVQDMKSIIDRCVQADQMNELALNKRNETIDLQSLFLHLYEVVPNLANRLRLHMSEPLSVTSDQQLLQIILSNLLDNAVRYSDPTTPIHVTAQYLLQDNVQGVEVQVGNVPGLAGWPDPDLIFSKYYRAPGAQRDSGSGLGLFLAQQLTGSLGGTLRYQPTDHLVEFVLWLPKT